MTLIFILVLSFLLAFFFTDGDGERCRSVLDQMEEGDSLKPLTLGNMACAAVKVGATVWIALSFSFGGRRSMFSS